MAVVLDPFAFRHWDDPQYHGARISDMNKDDFMLHLKDYIEKNGGFMNCSVEGYAPFCRHIFMPNCTSAQVDAIEITESVEKFIRTGYLARRSDELPVLCRWIKSSDIPGGVPKAAFLDLIFYSREQLILEAQAMKGEIVPGEWDWALISLKGQYSAHETPMQPITMMRNALGAEYGGSSVPLNHSKYIDSANHWNKYVSVE